jgi:hypothetical protein
MKSTTDCGLGWQEQEDLVLGDGWVMVSLVVGGLDFSVGDFRLTRLPAEAADRHDNTLP